LVLLLFAGVVLRPRRERVLQPSHAWPGGRGLGVLALGAALLTGGAAGAAAWAMVTVVALAVGAGARRKPALRHVMPALAAGCYLSAGAVLAVRHWGRVDYAAGSTVFQLLCLCALVSTAWASPRARSAAYGGAAQRPGDAATSPVVRQAGS